MTTQQVFATLIGLGIATLQGGASAQSLQQTRVSGKQSVNGQVMYDATGSNAYYFSPIASHLYGDAATGRMGMVAETALPGSLVDSSTDMAYQATFVNDSGTARNFVFNFAVNRGEVSVFASPYSPGASAVEMSAEVMVDGIDAWSTSAECSGFVCSHGGTDIGYAATDSIIGAGLSFDDYAGHVSLGVVQAGQSVHIDYRLHGEAAAYGAAGAEARFGLFSNFSQNDFSSLKGVNISAVPEPASMALLMAGIGLLGAVRRRADRS